MTITDVIEFLIKQKRKDLAEVVVRELKGNTKVIERYSQPLTPLIPIKPPFTVGDDPNPPYRITS